MENELRELQKEFKERFLDEIHTDDIMCYLERAYALGTRRVNEEEIAEILFNMKFDNIEMGYKYFKDEGGIGIRFYKSFCKDLAKAIVKYLEEG